MDRKKFVQSFSRRLVSILRKEGYETSRAGIGVDLSKVAKVTGCSYQMARKYVLGQALPEPFVIIKLATWLNTSASWLLFGDDDSTLPKNKTVATIEIEPALLKYILDKSSYLFSLTDKRDEILNFIVETIYDASHINADLKTIHKVVEMMITSATLFNKSTKDSNKLCANPKT